MKILILTLAIALILSSCKKDLSSSEVAKSCRITNFTASGDYDYEDSEYTFTYNSLGKAINIVSKNYKWIFSYEKDKMLVSLNNKLITYNYNSSGQIVTIKTTEQFPETVTINYANNKVSKILTSIDNISSTFTYTNDEVTKIIVKWGNIEYEEAKISYKNEKYSDPMLFEILFPSLIDGDIRHFIEYNLSDYLGNKEKRLIEKVEYIGKGIYGNTYTDTYSYLKDSSGNIIKVIINSTWFTTRSFNFTNSCK